MTDRMYVSCTDPDFAKWLADPVPVLIEVDNILAKARTLGARIKRGSHTEKVLRRCLVEALAKLKDKAT